VTLGVGVDADNIDRISTWPLPGADDTLRIAVLARRSEHMGFGIVRHGGGDLLPGSSGLTSYPKIYIALNREVHLVPAS